MYKDDTPSKIWAIVSPILIYIGVTHLVRLFFSMKNLNDINLADGSYMDILFEEAFRITLPVMCVAAAVSLPLLLLVMRKDKRAARYRVDHRHISGLWLILPAAGGAGASIGFNFFVIAANFNEIFSGYDEVADVLFSANPWLQLVAIGFIVPAVEEVIFRGLIFNRLKSFRNANTAIIMSAVIFGIYHGNALQGGYSFALGAILAFAYERYGRLAAPVIFHIAANLTSLALNEVDFGGFTAVTFGIGAALGAVVLAAVIYFIYKYVRAEYLPAESGDNDNSSPGSGGYRAQETEKPRYTVDDYYPKYDSDQDEE